MTFEPDLKGCVRLRDGMEKKRMATYWACAMCHIPCWALDKHEPSTLTSTVRGVTVLCYRHGGRQERLPNITYLENDGVENLKD